MSLRFLSVLALALLATPLSAAELYLRSGEISVYDGWNDAEAQRNEIGRIEGSRPAGQLSRLHRQSEAFYQIEEGPIEGIVRAEDFLLSETNPEEEGLIQFLPKNGARFFRSRNMRPPQLTNNGRYLINSDRAFFDLELERVVMQLGAVTGSGMGESVLTERFYVSTSTGTGDESRLIVYDTDNISSFREFSAYDFGLQSFSRIWHAKGDIIFGSGRNSNVHGNEEASLVAIDTGTGAEVARHTLASQHGTVSLARMADDRWLVLDRGFGGAPSQLYLLNHETLAIDERMSVSFASTCSGGRPVFSIFDEARIVQFGLECSDRSKKSFLAGVHLDRFELAWKRSEVGDKAIQYSPEVGYFVSPRYGDAFDANILTGARSDQVKPFPRSPRGQTQRSYVVTAPNGDVRVTFRGQIWVTPPRVDQTNETLSFQSGLAPHLEIERSGPGLNRTFEVQFPKQLWGDLDPDNNLFRTVISNRFQSNKSYVEWTLGEPNASVTQALSDEIFWISPPDQTPRTALTIFDLEDPDRRRFNIMPLAPETRISNDGTISLGIPTRQDQTSCRQSRGRDLWTWPPEPLGRFLLMNYCFIETYPAGGRWWHFDDPFAQLKTRCSYGADAPPCRSSNLDNVNIAHRIIDTEAGPTIVSYGIDPQNQLAVYVSPATARNSLQTFNLDVLSQDFHAYGQANRTYNAQAYVLPPLDGALRFLVRGVPKSEPKMRYEDQATPPSTWIYRFDLNGNRLGEPERSAEMFPNGLISSSYIAGNEEAIILTENSGGLYFFDPNFTQTRGYPRHPQVDNPRIQMGNGFTVVPRSETAHDVFRSRTGELLATLHLQANGDAIVLLPSGFFSFNRFSAAADILIRNRETNAIVPLSAFAEQFYRPDLVQAAFAGDPNLQLADARRTLSLADAFSQGAAPLVTRLTLSALPDISDAIQAEVTLDIGDGGLGWLLWHVNDRIIAVEEGQSAQPGTQARFSRTLPLDEGPNEVSVVVTNRSRIDRSEPIRVAGPTFNGTGAALGRIHLLSVAVADYDDDELDLAYPIRDAEAIEAALQQSTAAPNILPDSLKGRDISVTRLFDADVTRASVARAMEDIAAQMHPNDAFVLFVAGHGLTNEGRFHFLASDVRTGQDPATELRERAISQADWNRWISTMPAARTLVFFDACESGSALRMDAAFRLHQSVANGTTGRGTTRLMMSASAETQYALEGHEGHGAFTSVLLDAFRQGDQNDDGLVSLSELTSYVSGTLPSLTEDIWAYRQTPQISMIGDDIIIGRGL